MATSAGDRRVYLHVGLPKTGTTFLQTSLLRNRDALLEDGVLYPGGGERMFLAAVDVRGSHKAWGRKRSEVEGCWDALARRARDHEGVTVLSQELLAGASARRVTAAMTMLTGLDVHVVVTARDPARQATAEWQEGVKHGRRLTFEEFRRRVLDGQSETDYARRFRAAQDLPEVLARWGAHVPAGNVHVVCGPPAGAPPEVLWRRFGAVVGFDASRYEPAGGEALNASLGADEVDLLRRVNLALDKRIEQPAYSEVVKRLDAHQLQAAGGSAPPLRACEMYDDLTVVGGALGQGDRQGRVTRCTATRLTCCPLRPAGRDPAPRRRRPPREQVHVGGGGDRRAARRGAAGPRGGGPGREARTPSLAEAEAAEAGRGVRPDHRLRPSAQWQSPAGTTRAHSSSRGTLHPASTRARAASRTSGVLVMRPRLRGARTVARLPVVGEAGLTFDGCRAAAPEPMVCLL